MVNSGEGKQREKNEGLGTTEKRETSEERCGVPGPTANETGEVLLFISEDHNQGYLPLFTEAPE